MEEEQQLLNHEQLKSSFTPGTTPHRPHPDRYRAGSQPSVENVGRSLFVEYI